MDNIAIAKDANDLADRVALADVGQEFISKTGAFGCALDDAGDINEGNRGRDDFFRAKDARKDVEARIGNADDANIGFDCGEGVIRGEDIVLGERVKEGRLSDIRQTDDSDGEAHEG